MKQDKIELHIKIPNQTKYLSLIGKISEELAVQLQNYSGDRESLANHVNVVLTEALVNAIRHANADNPEEVVEVRIIVTEDELVMQVFDHGKGFDMNGVSQSLPNNREQLEDHGRGLFIMRSLMDSVDYYPVEGGNVLEMRKSFN